MGRVGENLGLLGTLRQREQVIIMVIRKYDSGDKDKDDLVTGL